MFIKLVKQVDVDLSQCVLRAELVYFVVNLVVDPGLIVADSVVLDGSPGFLFLEPVHHLNLLKGDHDTSLSSTGHVIDSVSLHTDLDGVIARYERKLCMPARIRGGRE